MHNIIAIVGMCGVGKSSVSDYLEKKGYKRIYLGGITMEKLKEAGIEVNAENEKMMREHLRQELGMGAYAKILLPRIKASAQEGNTVLDGLYSWDELKVLQEEFKDALTVVAIIADKNIRYRRLEKRNGRALTKEEAIKRDISEIENIAKAGPIAYADYYIDNNQSLDDCYRQLDEILKKREENDNHEY